MNIWNFILKKLKSNINIYLMVVTESTGSSPGKQGFKMAVCSDNTMFGSIGGGVMEFNLVEECKMMLSENKKEYRSIEQVHNGDKEGGSGMMCSGKQTIVAFPVLPSEISTIEKISDSILQNRQRVIEISRNRFCFSSDNLQNTEQYSYEAYDDQWKYLEIIGIQKTVNIIGAGHVGYSVSRIFSQLGFNVVMFDNRPDLEMLQNNPFANYKHIINYNDIDNLIEEGKNSFVIIMTNNHQHDVDVLEKVLGKRLGYIGLMGSKAKVAKFRTILINKGFTEDELNKVHAPIGIDIASITPDEIAISIAAEVIKVKNSN